MAWLTALPVVLVALLVALAAGLVAGYQSGATSPWLIVDPKPYVGDPAYDAIQHMLNFPDRLAADPGAFADRMAGLLGVDTERVRQWLFARCVVDAERRPDLWSVAVRLSVPG